MALINLTPHTVRVAHPDRDEYIELSPAGTVARVAVTSAPRESIDGLPVVETSFGEPEGLPEPAEGTYFVVSTLVAQAAARLGRTDVLAPDTGPDSVIRDPDGQIVAVRRLQRFAPLGAL